MSGTKNGQVAEITPKGDYLVDLCETEVQAMRYLINAERICKVATGGI